MSDRTKNALIVVVVMVCFALVVTNFWIGIGPD